MCNLIKYAMNSLRKFTLLDVSIFKINLCLVGILLGAYFSSFFLEYITIVWAVAIVTYIFLMVRLVQYGRRKKD